ncbi:unnamed protein product [Didymodactylos carnosus]|uniref:Uncharacterized protein n=1 Tax=Didymodactylos carnosus TaxID=1234261 RepID=A0A815HZ05_9BILA|nr:unnamed protein product [Didymodactylos carnosus]CAF4231302.1 unnamed protein product [Didymodactylos carnosus]
MDIEHETKNQIYSTRIIISLLIVLVIVLAIYTGIQQQTILVTIQSPSVEQFNTVAYNYPNTLICPCSNLAIEYNTFITFNLEYHQICSSDFITPAWISYVGYSHNIIMIHNHLDFRSAGNGLFILLADFCKLVNQTIDDALIVFKSTQFISSNAISSTLFNIQVNALIDLFIQTTTDTFGRSLSIVRQTTQANRIMSGTLTSWTILFETNTSIPIMIAQKYGTCDCGSSPSCFTPAGFYDENIYILNSTVPGFYSGCYILESLFKSNFECLFNEACLNNSIKFHLDVVSTINIRVLNISAATIYKPNTSIEQIVLNMMIEQWNPNSFHKSYYDKCKPNYCTYTYVKRFGIVYIITTILALIGGLITVLQILVIRIIAFIRAKKKPIVSTRRGFMSRDIKGRYVIVWYFYSCYGSDYLHDDERCVWSLRKILTESIILAIIVAVFVGIGVSLS